MKKPFRRRGSTEHRRLLPVSSLGSWYEVSNESSRLISMEGTRGLAVLLVFLVHFHALFSSYVAPGSFSFSASRFMGLIGNTGVDLFFVISGYLIYGAVIRQRTTYAHFVRRRIERIYPTFLAVLGLYLALSWMFPSASRVHGPFWSGAYYILQNLLLLPGILSVTPIITVAWSLSYEFFFYLSLPMIVLITGAWKWRPRARATFFGVVGIAYLVGSAFLPSSHVRLVMFVSGILLHEALNSGRFRLRLSRPGEIVAVLFFLASLGIAYALDTKGSWFAAAFPAWTHGRTMIEGVPGYQGPYKTLFLSVSCFWFAAYCFGYGGFLKRALSWSPLRYLGNMSYSYYLLHGLTLKGVAEAFGRIALPKPHSPALYAALLAAGFCATWVSPSVHFLMVEKPFSLAPRSVFGSRVFRRVAAAGSSDRKITPEPLAVAASAAADERRGLVD
ncbi:MAG TPA: acyltransferase [Terriglobales bacterium]